MKRLGKSFDQLGTTASDALSQIIIHGGDAKDTVKQLLAVLASQFVGGLFDKGGLLRPTKKNTGGTIYPGRAYEVHERETVVPLGQPMQVIPASQTRAGGETVNISIDARGSDEAGAMMAWERIKPQIVREFRQVANHERNRRDRRAQLGASH